MGSNVVDAVTSVIMLRIHGKILGEVLFKQIWSSITEGHSTSDLLLCFSLVNFATSSVFEKAAQESSGDGTKKFNPLPKTQLNNYY